MAWTVERTDRQREGRKVRLYASSVFVKPTGQDWARIAGDGVPITRDALTGAYRIACGDDWITFTPKKRIAGVLKRTVLGGVRFGDVLNPGTHDAIVEYDVAFSGGVEHAADGWVFTKATGARVGLFLNDWVNRFVAGRITRRSDYAAIDLTDIEADEFGEINLDPTTTKYTHANSGTIDGYSNFMGSWADARSGVNKTAYSGTITPIRAEAVNNGAIYSCWRGFMAFDTSGLNPSSASLKICTKVKYANDGTIHVHITEDWTPDLTTADFGIAAGNSVGSVAVASLELGVYETLAVDIGDIVDGTTPMLVRENHDVVGDGDAPGSNTDYGAAFYELDETGKEPYLEIVEPGLYNASILTGGGLGTSGLLTGGRM